MVDDTTAEGEESPVTTNKHSKRTGLGRIKGSYGACTLEMYSVKANTGLSNDARYCSRRPSYYASHVLFSNIRVKAMIFLTLLATTVTGIIETSGVRHMWGPVGRRLVRDSRVITRNRDVHQTLSLSVRCNRPPGVDADAWCVAAGFEITSPCAADFVQSAYTDFADFDVCTYNVIAQVGWLPGCDGDMEVSLYATCLETQ